MKEEGEKINLQLVDSKLVHHIVHYNQLKFGDKIAKYS